jgi:hypothetical protein
MERNIVALAATVLVAGVASMLAVMPSGQSARSTPVEAKPSPELAAVAAAGKPSLEARHAPVPLVLKPRPTVELPAVAEAAQPPPETAKAPDPAGGAAAKAAVELDGYKAVKVLRKGDNGLWYAEALRGSTKVRLTVDAQGTVTTE